MSSAAQNRNIARLIVGAMSIDGELSPEEQQKVAGTLETIGMGELIADVGAALEDDCGTFNMYDECKALNKSLGAEAAQLAPLIFRVITDVLASDRFVSAQEALYLSAIAKRLGIKLKHAQQIFKEVMALRRGRLEQSGDNINANLNPHLKELLSFEGADSLVGEANENSIEEMMHIATNALSEGEQISKDDMLRALTILGLDGNATLDDAEIVWLETIETLNLPKMAKLGETFVSAAIGRITRINDAYKTILHFHESLK